MTQQAATRRSDPRFRRTVPRDDHLEADAGPLRPSPHVSLLVATALGFAYTSATPLEAHVRALGALAEPAPEALEQARTTVLEVEIATPQVRADAADLLLRAAHRVAGLRRYRKQRPSPR